MFSLYRAGPLKTVASEMAKCNLDLVTVQEVRWVEGGSQLAVMLTSLRGRIFVHQGIRLAVKRVELLVTGCHIKY
jgi:hypothetical protein